MMNLRPDLCRWGMRRLAGFTLLVSALTFSGCDSLQHIPTSLQDLGPVYQPTNFYRRYAVLPAELQRVALLPLTLTSDSAELQAGADNLSPQIYLELVKTKRFEIIPVTPERLQQLTGKRGWKSDEPLPPQFFKELREATGCDAVLFCQLTGYKPYQPLAVGWKFALVETSHRLSPAADFAPQIAWSVDELLDSGDPAVANAARWYYSAHLKNETPSSDASTMISSPTRFGQYTLATLFSTLPDRQFSTK